MSCEGKFMALPPDENILMIMIHNVITAETEENEIDKINSQ